MTLTKDELVIANEGHLLGNIPEGLRKTVQALINSKVEIGDETTVWRNCPRHWNRWILHRKNEKWCVNEESKIEY